MLNIQKAKSTVVYFLMAMLLGSRVALAVGCVNLSFNSCADVDLAVAGQIPDPRAFACILGRILNVAIGLVGLAFIYMVIWGALKLSMSYGDPKGYKGAQDTWVYAFLGFLVVVGFFALYVIIANVLGLPVPTPQSFTDMILHAIGSVMDAACVCCQTGGCADSCADF